MSNPFLPHRFIRWLMATLLVLGLLGRVAAADKPKSAEPFPPSSDVLNVGDKVRIVFTDITNPPPAQDTQIPESGFITLHLGHKFNFKGKNRDALETEIREYYITNGIFRIINVVIEVPSRPITVGGEVRTPNSYPHPGRLTVLKAIDLAGGFTEFANRRKVKIIRSGKTIVVNCKKALEDPEKFDVEVFPGDKVQVDRGWL